MKILNLVYPDKSDIKYKISKFPDGQQNISIDFNIFEDIRANNKIQGYSHQVEIHRDYEVLIKSRLNNWLDLELVTCAVACLKECQVFNIHLYVPYIVGARSDRKFEEGGNNYLKDVICPVINSLNFESVTCIDPHSDVLGNLLNNFKQIHNDSLVEWAIKQIDSKNIDNPTDFIPIAPDAGSLHKIYKTMSNLGYKGDIITCSKERDTNGKLTKVVVPLEYNQVFIEKDKIIIDDICDGGATFINIAKIIKDTQNRYLKDEFTLNKGTKKEGKIYLIVTHGIFSKGLEELNHYFDGIYCTNSYRQVNDEEWMNCKRNFVKQLNVF